jgi:hypothetical protein
MARNTVMKLWTAVVTAFLALCAALGFTTTTAAAAVPQTQPMRNTAAPVPLPKQSAHTGWSRHWSLPPTMKQRIRAEAHGAAPACRHRPLATNVPMPTFAHCALRSRAEPPAYHDPLTVRLRR